MKSDYGKPAKEGYSKGYDKAWLRVFGEVCPICADGRLADKTRCPNCNGVGYKEKEKK